MATHRAHGPSRVLSTQLNSTQRVLARLDAHTFQGGEAVWNATRHWTPHGQLMIMRQWTSRARPFGTLHRRKGSHTIQRHPQQRRQRRAGRMVRPWRRCRCQSVWHGHARDGWCGCAPNMQARPSPAPMSGEVWRGKGRSERALAAGLSGCERMTANAKRDKAKGSPRLQQNCPTCLLLNDQGISTCTEQYCKH